MVVYIGYWTLNIYSEIYIIINKEGMDMIGMKYDRNAQKKTFWEIIQEYGRRWWRNGSGINEREQQYVHVIEE